MMPQDGDWLKKVVLDTPEGDDEAIARGAQRGLELLRQRAANAKQEKHPGLPVPNYRHLHERSLAANRPDVYRDLKRNGQLRTHLDDTARQAGEMHATIVRQMAERNPFDPNEWNGNRGAWEGWLERTAREIVLNDVILVPDEESERAMREGGYTD